VFQIVMGFCINMIKVCIFHRAKRKVELSILLF
jgi:hypothetical protein